MGIYNFSSILYQFSWKSSYLEACFLLCGHIEKKFAVRYQNSRVTCFFMLGKGLCKNLFRLCPTFSHFQGTVTEKFCICPDRAVFSWNTTENGAFGFTFPIYAPLKCILTHKMPLTIMSEALHFLFSIELVFFLLLWYNHLISIYAVAIVLQDGWPLFLWNGGGAYEKSFWF